VLHSLLADDELAGAFRGAAAAQFSKCRHAVLGCTATIPGGRLISRAVIGGGDGWDLELVTFAGRIRGRATTNNTNAHGDPYETRGQVVVAMYARPTRRTGMARPAVVIAHGAGSTPESLFCVGGRVPGQCDSDDDDDTESSNGSDTGTGTGTGTGEPVFTVRDRESRGLALRLALRGYAVLVPFLGPPDAAWRRAHAAMAHQAALSPLGLPVAALLASLDFLVARRRPHGPKNVIHSVFPDLAGGDVPDWNGADPLKGVSLYGVGAGAEPALWAASIDGRWSGAVLAGVDLGRAAGLSEIARFADLPPVVQWRSGFFLFVCWFFWCLTFLGLFAHDCFFLFFCFFCFCFPPAAWIAAAAIALRMRAADALCHGHVAGQVSHFRERRERRLGDPRVPHHRRHRGDPRSMGCRGGRGKVRVPWIEGPFFFLFCFLFRCFGFSFLFYDFVCPWHPWR
jgi:hypothetical protein